MTFEEWFDSNAYASWDNACDVAMEAWNYQQERIDDLKKLQVQPDKSGSFFICGEGGNSDEHGLPEFTLVCPQSGANIIAVYKRDLVGKSGQ